MDCQSFLIAISMLLSINLNEEYYLRQHQALFICRCSNELWPQCLPRLKALKGSRLEILQASRTVHARLLCNAAEQEKQARKLWFPTLRAHPPFTLCWGLWSHLDSIRHHSHFQALVLLHPPVPFSSHINCLPVTVDYLIQSGLFAWDSQAIGPIVPPVQIPARFRSLFHAMEPIEAVAKM